MGLSENDSIKRTKDDVTLMFLKKNDFTKVLKSRIYIFIILLSIFIAKVELGPPFIQP